MIKVTFLPFHLLNGTWFRLVKSTLADECAITQLGFFISLSLTSPPLSCVFRYYGHRQRVVPPITKAIRGVY